MKVILQRVTEASVAIDQQIVGSIGLGFMLLVGIAPNDTEEDVKYVARKVAKMRIFDDEEGKMNLSLDQVGGQILSISQFTLFADTRKGNRPSFTDAASPDIGETYYQLFNRELQEVYGLDVETGRFGADMAVSLVNDGPVTIIVDSKDR
ncbi:MAG: D-aminoacyl-tRNA deacylase [Aerococcus sp.]|nr:D-aminoacyl-tRNA deacylase [Aerococcus sp.]